MTFFQWTERPTGRPTRVAGRRESAIQCGDNDRFNGGGGRGI